MPPRDEFARLADRGAANPPNGGGDVARVYTLEGGDPLVEVRQQHHDLLNSHLSFPFIRSADADGHPRGFNNPSILYSR